MIKERIADEEDENTGTNLYNGNAEQREIRIGVSAREDNR